MIETKNKLLFIEAKWSVVGNFMDKGNIIVLDLCGGSGSWSKPFREAGYDVRLITLPDYDVLTYEPRSPPMH